MGLLYFWGGSLSLLVLGFVVGRYNEHRHYRSIQTRQRHFAYIKQTNFKRLPKGLKAQESYFCLGSMVVAVDYWKIFLAKWKKLFGGRLRSLETLVDRGRREAVLRLLEHAEKCGADWVINIRIETSTMGGQSKKKKFCSGIEVIAYGTAIQLDKSA
jgi:uncharacterized protein YbjQ (UPF0145 family)